MNDFAFGVFITAIVAFPGGFMVAWYVFQKGTLAYYESKMAEFKAELTANVNAQLDDIVAKAQKKISEHEQYNIAKGKLKAAMEIQDSFITHGGAVKDHRVLEFLNGATAVYAAELRKLK